jgi:hypothetical protein
VGAAGRLPDGGGCGRRAAVRDAGLARAGGDSGRELDRRIADVKRVADGQFERGEPAAGNYAFGDGIGVGFRIGGDEYAGRADDEEREQCASLRQQANNDTSADAYACAYAVAFANDHTCRFTNADGDIDYLCARDCYRNDLDHVSHAHYLPLVRLTRVPESSLV